MNRILPALLAAVLFYSPVSYAREASGRQQALESVKKATRYMMDVVSYRGGFVWEYLPDLSRQWGELETKRTMVSTQENGTPEMGNILLDLYHLTGDEYYYQAAEKVADALIWGQLPCGGWNYVFDMAGEESLKDWYNTVGRNALGFEEYYHYYGNATFDDDATTAPCNFLMRMCLEKNDPRYRAAVDKAINMVVEAQYPIGGWPQRYPLMYDYPYYRQGRGDYTSCITYNDRVHDNNIRFLITCYKFMGGHPDLRECIYRAMNCTLALQQGNSQPGWAEQYDPVTLSPHGARNYEPRCIHPRNTYWCVEQMLDYYALTGEDKFIARIPQALDWIASAAVPDDTLSAMGIKKAPGMVYAVRDVEIGTGKPLAWSRVGTNALNTEYTIINRYSPASITPLRVDALRKRYEEATRIPVSELTARSPLTPGNCNDLALPSLQQIKFYPGINGKEVEEILSSQKPEGYWITPLRRYSQPYTQDGSKECTDTKTYYWTWENDGGPDPTSTATFNNRDTSITGISTRAYMDNVSKIMSYYFPEFNKTQKREKLPW